MVWSRHRENLRSGAIPAREIPAFPLVRSWGARSGPFPGIATFGISPLTEVHDVSVRPYRVAEGRSINEVLA
jgi:hypothetical protein